MYQVENEDVAMYQVENEDVVGAAPTGDAPTTSKWSTVLLAHKGATDIRDLTVYILVWISYSLDTTITFCYLENCYLYGIVGK